MRTIATRTVMALVLASSLAASAAALAADPVAPPRRMMTQDMARQWAMMARTRMAEGQAQAALLRGARAQAALRAALEGRTRLLLVPDYGLYAVYTAPGGRLHAWFPGQTAAVGGTWGVQQVTRKTSAACMRFERPGRTRDGAFQPDECVAPERTLGASDVVESWEGDVFGLAGGAVPHVKQAWELVGP